MSCDISFSELLGWKMGFEPTTLGTTILYSNRLSYIHHLICFPNRVQIYTLFSILQNFRQLNFQKKYYPCKNINPNSVCHSGLYRAYLGILEQLLDCLCHYIHVGGRLEALYNLTLAVYKELCEVPLNIRV